MHQHSRRSGMTRLLGLAVVCLPAVAAHAQTDLLPDLFFFMEESEDNEIDTETLEGRVLFRFSTSIPNVGLGEFVLESTGEDAGNGREEVVQRIFRDDGTSYTRDAGGFVYNPNIAMMEADGWVSYRIREILPGDGVGEILAEGGKPAVRITSTRLHDGSLPNVPSSGDRIFAEDGRHGISVGYTDIYPKFLELQWIDITGLPSGEYWLELEVDPGGHVLESDETNNVSRMKVTLEIPDEDGDGLTAEFEEQIGTDPMDADSDGDGLRDDEEVGYDGDVSAYNPYNPQSNPSGTDLDANEPDTDRDGFDDMEEVNFGSDPIDPASAPSGLPVGGLPLFLLLLLLGFFGLLTLGRGFTAA